MLSGLPLAARGLLQELLDLQLLGLPSIKDFLFKSADTLPTLTTRDRTANALATHGLLTNYQRDRVIGGHASGLVIGNYRILDPLGGGSSAVVFLGEHVPLRRRVAIKVLPVDDSVLPQMVERLHAEGHALASLDHPHIVTAHDAGVFTVSGSTQALHYLVLEFVSGGDLEQFVYAHGPQSVPRCCEWGWQAAAGLQAAHERQLIHRDLKPSNILLTADQRVKIIDFGLARRNASSLTRTRMLVGSVDFMAPEQSLDPTGVGPAADVYGLGATLFWILTGQLPFPHQSSLAEMLQVLSTEQPRRVQEFRPEVPSELSALIDRMLFRDSDARPTALGVMKELATFRKELGGSSPSGEIRTMETEWQHGGEC
jgi:serine/threonine-protein kinase